jgi:hypothetical protein
MKGNNKHGFAKKGAVHPMYAVWLAMKQRCTNPKHKNWADYGGRGITLCESWLTFDGFYADMWEDYALGLTIERTDNDKGYTKENCRWATRAEQTRNNRRNVWVTFRGKTQVLQDWAKELGVSRQAFYYWVKKGMTYDQAVERVGC